MPLLTVRYDLFFRLGRIRRGMGRTAFIIHARHGFLIQAALRGLRRLLDIARYGRYCLRIADGLSNKGHLSSFPCSRSRTRSQVLALPVRVTVPTRTHIVLVNKAHNVIGETLPDCLFAGAEAFVLTTLAGLWETNFGALIQYSRNGGAARIDCWRPSGFLTK